MHGMPPLLPWTEAAASAFAETSGAGVGDDVWRLLFALCWRDGADTGSPDILRTRWPGRYFVRSFTC
jgi:hypothetical protein